jgi:hypothetical protein
MSDIGAGTRKIIGLLNRLLVPRRKDHPVRPSRPSAI